MDLLEYQGKELFKKHGVPVPRGSHAASVQDAVAAAEELGYPVVIKAQVQIGGRDGLVDGGRGRAGGDGHAVAGEELLALILEEVHWRPREYRVAGAT